jgi:hypothetical protein
MVSCHDGATDNPKVADVLGEWQRAGMGNIKNRRVDGPNRMNRGTRMWEAPAPLANIDRSMRDRQATDNFSGSGFGEFEILN